MKYAIPFIFIIFLHSISFTQSQPSTIGYNCTTTTNQTSPNTCQTYVFFRAKSPDLLDLASVGDLFSVSRAMISNPSNITYPNTTLLPDQSLFIPITCSCNRVNSSITISYATLNYTIKSGDTFYLVSTQKYGNLTTYQSVEVVNPTFEPTRLNIGDVITFPIFCKCPNSTLMQQKRVNYLISYVFQPSDSLTSVASRFGITENDIVQVNGNNGINPLDTIFIPVSKLPNITQPATTPSTISPKKSDQDKGAVIGLGIGLGICVLLLILVSVVFLYRERFARSKEVVYRDAEEKLEKVNNMGKKSLKAEEMNLMADVSDCLDKYKVFGIGELRNATDDFDDRWLIKGSVYKGCIDGEWIAIKKMKWNAYEELKILQKVNHGNLVRLEGFCIDTEEANCYLVYEYLENGSLHSWLHDENTTKKTSKLSWKTRLRIAIDVANGLQYIHEHTRPKVVHKDIKSSNILLDSNMRAKIANFGLARSGFNAITMHIVGTQGYIAPEYLSDGIVSTKMDVFSFGVVLLELVSGREAVDEKGNVLWSIAGGVLEGNNEESKMRRLKGFVEECLVGEITSAGVWDSVASVVAVALACVNKNLERRPNMVEIVYALCKSDDLLFDVSEDGFSPRQVVAR